jgi:uncharacterized protein (TIGR03083 family)
MEYSTFVEHVRRDGSRLRQVARGDLGAAVPSCPGWSVDDLVRHVAEVYEHKIACTLLGRAPDPWPPDWPADRDPIEWLPEAHARLLELFDRSEPTSPSATWWPPDQTVGFWARRMAHETAVHRVDGELAAGTPSPIDPDLAADGIAEILEIMLAGDWKDEPDDAASGQRVFIQAGGEVGGEAGGQAGGRSWLVTIERAAVDVTEGVRDGGTAHARIEGEPADVDLWLWGRAPDARVRRSGDDRALALLRSRLTLATQ